MPICRRRCSRTPLIVRPRLSRSTTSRRTLQPLSRRSSTKSTIRHGIALSAGTLVATLRTRHDTSYISTWVKWQFFCSKADKLESSCDSLSLSLSLSLSPLSLSLYHSLTLSILPIQKFSMLFLFFLLF